MTDIPLLVPSSNNPWVVWMGTFMSDNPQATVGIIGTDENDWQSFANSLQNRLKMGKYGIPTPYGFERWQDWVNEMAMSSIGNL